MRALLDEDVPHSPAERACQSQAERRQPEIRPGRQPDQRQADERDRHADALPAILVSLAAGDEPSLVGTLLGASWLSLAAAVYLGVVATAVAYAVWGSLLQRYSTAAVAPFALLAPCTGVVSSAVVFREVFSPVRYAGMALILGGLAVTVLPARRPVS